MGHFSPGGFCIELAVSHDDLDREEHRSQWLAVLMHERTHWLQFVGTSAGLFSAYIAAVQQLVLFGDTESNALELNDLPLLDSTRITSAQRENWIECEIQAALLDGGDKQYLDALVVLSSDAGRETVSRHIRTLTRHVMGDAGETWDAVQTAIWPDEFTNDVQTLQLPNVEFGTRHLMEAGARLNEIFEFAARQGSASISGVAAFAPPYGFARDMFYEVTGTDPNYERDAALCILGDWALMYPLPPIMPLLGGGSRDISSPGWLFLNLICMYDDQVLPQRTKDGPACFANELAAALYEDIGPKVGMLTPPLLAETTCALLSELTKLTIPDAIYAHDPYPSLLLPGDNLVTARLRYLTRHAGVAARTRLEQPAFFALPFFFYREDRAFFHSLYDPIAAPLTSARGARFRPARGGRWFDFFFCAAVAHDAARLATYRDPHEIARGLQTYANTFLNDGETDAFLVDRAIRHALGDGPAAQSVSDEWHRLTSVT